MRFLPCSSISGILESAAPKHATGIDIAAGFRKKTAGAVAPAVPDSKLIGRLTNHANDLRNILVQIGHNLLDLVGRIGGLTCNGVDLVGNIPYPGALLLRHGRDTFLKLNPVLLAVTPDMKLGSKIGSVIKCTTLEKGHIWLSGR